MQTLILKEPNRLPGEGYCYFTVGKDDFAHYQGYTIVKAFDTMEEAKSWWDKKKIFS